MKTESLTIETALSSKWGIIAYDLNGKSYRGVLVFDTQEEALERIDMIAELQRNLMTKDGPLDMDDYSHAIAVPC